MLLLCLQRAELAKDCNSRREHWLFRVSVGDYDSHVPIGDYNRSLEYYKPYLEKGDPYYNPNLDLMNESIGIRRDCV